MSATIGNTASYFAATATNTHTANLTLGSNSRRKVVVGVVFESATISVTDITINGVSVIANDRSDNPDTNPNDTSLKMRWFDYDVPSGTAAGAIPITVTSSSSALAVS